MFSENNLETFNMLSRIISLILILLVSNLNYRIIIYTFSDGFPIIFKQRRIGNSHEFIIYKFRTMKIM